MAPDSTPPRRSLVDPVPNHRSVLEAVEAGDPKEAEAAMRYAIRESDLDLTSGEPAFTVIGYDDLDMVCHRWAQMDLRMASYVSISRNPGPLL